MGIIDLDYVARFEDIEKDFYYLSNFIGIKVRLQKHNRGFLNSKYVLCRSKKSDEVIENYFKEDFEAFNYSFGNF